LTDPLPQNEEARALIARLSTTVFTEEWLLDFMGTVKGLHKGYQVDHKCSQCGSRQKITVQIPDFKQILNAVTELFNQGFGRPGTADAESSGVEIIVHRHWPAEESSAR